MAGVSHISDRDFFGEWDVSSASWKITGRINYAYSRALSRVEDLVKLGDYSDAKEELLKYYRTRSSIPRADFDGAPIRELITLNYQDVYSFTEAYITKFTVDNTDSYKEYKIDLGIPRHSVFLISSFNKTADMVCLGSRESEYSPALEVIRRDGTIVTLSPSRDTYIRGYDETADYSKENYGKSAELYVKDSMHVASNGRYKPFSSKSRRAYVAFDGSKIPADAAKMYLKLQAKLVPDEDRDKVTDTAHDIHVFSAYNQSWAEYEGEKSAFAPMTWANYRLAHYSWNGIPGGFDWVRPDNCPSEYITYNTRFYGHTAIAMEGVRTGNKAYLDRAIELVLDFIADTNGRIETENVPPRRDIESADRCCKIPGIFAAFLDHDGFTADAMTDILKWLSEEMVYLYNGAGILYEGATAIPTENNYAETNRGLWHVKGMQGVCTYFPEFAARDEWKRLANERLDAVGRVLINKDGCYEEATFGYAAAMVGYFLSIYKFLLHSGDPIPAWFNDRLRNFLYYLMYNSYPSHQPPFLGEGSSSSTVGALRQYLRLTDDPELRYAATDGAEGIKPSKTAAYFDRLKTASCRTGWSNTDSMIFMTAKNGGNHNHKDSLMLTFFAGDKELLTDTGMTSYDGLHPHFKWQRHATRSHNTVEIDGKPQRGTNFLYNSNPAQPNGEASLNLTSGEMIDRIEAWTDATEGFRHYRDVSYLKSLNIILVSDMIRPFGGNTSLHTYTQNWHTYAQRPSHPEINDETKTGRTNYESGSNLFITQLAPEGVTLSLEEGYSALSTEPTKYFCFTKEGACDTAFHTLILPFWDEKETAVTVFPIDLGVSSATAYAAEIVLPQKDGSSCKVIYYNSFEDTPVRRAFGSLETDAAGAIVILDPSDNVICKAVYGGTMLRLNGKEIV